MVLGLALNLWADATFKRAEVGVLPFGAQYESYRRRAPRWLGRPRTLARAG